MHSSHSVILREPRSVGGLTRTACASDVANRSTELDLPYPDLQDYIADMNVMMALIINGPV